MPKPNRPQTCHGAVKEPMRNARTAAGFEPTPSKMPLCEASESLERQQASCPRHAKHKPEKRQPKTVRSQPFHMVPKLLATDPKRPNSSPRQAKCPYAKLPKASNGSKLRAQGMQNTSQQKCFPLPLESIKHVLWPAPSLRGWVRNQYTATPNAVEDVMRSFRKPRTAARFVPKACKTQARKKASQKRRVRNPSTWCRNCWQRIRKGQTPLQAELGQAKNDAFATLPHGAETAASKP